MRAKEFIIENKTTLNKLYGGNFPDRDELFWDEVRPDEFDKPLEIKTMPTLKLAIMLQSQYRVEHLDEILDMMDEDQQEILQRYMNDPNLSNKIILLSGDRIIDGNHRALAAAMRGMSINYVDLVDLDEQGVAEGFATPLPEVLYHGGKTPITTFKIPPYGVYFSPHKNWAKHYGNVITAAKVNAKNVYLVDYTNDIDDEIVDALFDRDYQTVAKFIKLLQVKGFDALQTVTDSEMIVAFPGTPIQVIDVEQGVAESFDKEAGAWREWQLKMLPRKMEMLSRLVKGWVPSEEDHIAAIEAGYVAMRDTGDVKDAAKAISDTFKEIQSRQGVAEDTVNLPLVLYHATYKPRLKSIKLKGLGAGGKRNWEDSKRGIVYLSLDPNVAESYAETSDMVPEEWLDEIVILKISTAGLDPNKFHIDSNVQDNAGDTIEYHGVIPVSNISMYKQGVTEDTVDEGSIPVYKSPSQFYAGAGKTLYKLFRNAFPNLPEHVANDIYNQTSPGTNDTIVNALKQGQDPKSVFLNYYSGITFNFSKDPGTSLTPQQMKTVLLNGRWRQKILTVNPADFAEHSRNRMVKRNFGINPDEDPTRIQRQQSRAKGDGSNEPVIIIQTSNGLILWEGFHRTMSILALGKNGEDPLKWNKVKLRAWVVEIPNQKGVTEDNVDEMALQTYKTMGDFTKQGPFTGADKKLVPHPKNIEKATRFFEQTPFDFRLFFSNIPGTGKYSEYGPMAPDELRKVFGKDAEEIIAGSENAITVVYVGNKGDRKVMLTPWMMAHRFGHAVNRGAYKAGSVGAWKEAEKHFFNTVNSLLNDYYGKIGRTSSDIKYELTPEYNALFNAIGTQRSSRSGEIRRPYEFFYELFAQYLGTGQITLNPFPTNLTYGRKAWGNPTRFMNIKPEYRDENERKYAAEILARDMEIMFNDVLSNSVGQIFVM